MRKLITIIALIFASYTFGQTSKITQLFDQYQNTKGITSIKIAKPMFQLINSLDINDSDMAKIKPLISKINSLRIIVLEKDSENATQFTKLQSDITAALKGLNYEELMAISEDGESIKILSENTQSNLLNNLLLSINGEDETVFMVLEGLISMEDINGLISNEEK
ncbi:MAG TPA: DUF4252 domain-containing protein [Taishania sp.]|nr:DUF4252 domain-containing protein [Taishania sp.]